MRYTLVALPDLQTRGQLDQIRAYFYQNGFRYSVSPLRSTAHSTLAQLEGDAPLRFRDDFFATLQECSEVMIQDFSLVAQPHTWIANFPEWQRKYPQGCGRVALRFQSLELQALAGKLIQTAKNLKSDRSFDYAKAIASVQGIPDQEIQLFDYLANHINLCNYARLEKIEEAVFYFHAQFALKERSMDRVALVSEEQELIRDVPLRKL